MSPGAAATANPNTNPNPNPNQALLPLLDGAFGDQQAEEATAGAAAAALASLVRDSPANAQVPLT